MAFAITHFFKGATKEQYDRSLRAVHPAGGLPKGQIYHVAGTSPGGVTIFAVHDSRKSWETFRDTILTPAMQKGIEGGMQGAPAETDIEVFNLQAAKAPETA
ncbi:MAG: hypothetical protein KJN93_03340 [Alphaproteobacteria bacterium]|nr:hypothetical protein [Alphaproteobacteria bacterium]NNF24048.1 hypothetical protein [Paracoccaceae bacterium]